MPSSTRYFEAARPALLHLFFSALIALLVCALILWIWYPTPYDHLAGGRNLLFYIVAVDVICGPMLTYVVFDRKKSRRALTIDICTIVTVQLLALGYGLSSAAQARPIFLAFEGNRYRLVSLADIDKSSLPLALPQFQNPSLTGPQWVGVRLSEATDRDFPYSVQLSLAGLHPSFRPQRWVAYETQLEIVRNKLQPVQLLIDKNPASRSTIDRALARLDLKKEQVGYLPLSAEKAEPADWVVLVERSSGHPRDILPLNGW